MTVCDNSPLIFVTAVKAWAGLPCYLENKRYQTLFFFSFLGSSKRQILTLAARSLAGQFRERLRASADSLMENALVM